LDALASPSFRKDARVIGVVGTAHALSHFFQLVLPPLFPLLRAEFDVSFATLGALVSVFYVSSGVCQFGAGFAVDRFGARPVLLGGLSLLAGGVLLAGSVPSFYWLFPLAAIMGLGNGVFHPAEGMPTARMASAAALAMRWRRWRASGSPAPSAGVPHC
jgi:MFS transporter, FSR family, fosmidomycin resistance protein